jgi:hypothetical protein
MKVKVTINVQKDYVEISVGNEKWQAFNETLNLHSDQTFSKSIELEIKSEDLTHVAEEVKKYIIYENSVELYRFFTSVFATLLEPGQAIELEALSFLGVQCPYCGIHSARYIVKLPHVFGSKTTMYCGRCFKIASNLVTKSQQKKEVLV